MALSDLLRAIEDDANAERLVHDRKTAAAAAAIIEQARSDAVAVEAELAAAPELEARAEAARRLALARLAVAGAVRAAREDAFISLRDALCDQLAGLRRSERYPAVFRALLHESRSALPGAEELRIDPRDADLAASLAVDMRVVTALDTWGGVELADDRGRTIRNTLEERLANADPLLRRRFAAWLASEQGLGQRGDP